MLYISILLLLFILSYSYDYIGKKSGRLTWYIIMLIIFICVAGLRYQLGIDSVRYERLFASMPDLSYLSSYDFSQSRYGIGYIAFNAIARSISDEFVAMQFLQAIYVNCVIFWFFFRYSKKIFFCIIIYALGLYFNFMCEVMREACAVATLLLAWPYFESKSWIKYYILAIICVLFHTSGFVALILPILYLPKIRNLFIIGKKTILILFGVFICASVIGYGFVDYLKIFYFISGFEDNVNNYANDDLSGQVLNIKGIISSITTTCLYPYLAIIYLNSKCNSNRCQSTTFPMSFMVGICLIMAVVSIPIAIFYRYNNYFFPFAIAAIGNWVYVKRPFSRLKINFNFSIWMLLFVPYFFFTTYGYFTIRNDGDIYEQARYYPYSSIIEKSTDSARTRVQRYHQAI